MLNTCIACVVVSAAQDQKRAAIVDQWLELSGMSNAPVEDLVSAAKFAYDLSQAGAKSSQFGRKATMLRMYMQSSTKFAQHFGPTK